MNPRDRLRLIVLGYAADGDGWQWGNVDHTEIELTEEEKAAQKATPDELQEIHPKAKGKEKEDKAEADEDENLGEEDEDEDKGEEEEEGEEEDDEDEAEEEEEEEGDDEEDRSNGTSGGTIVPEGSDSKRSTRNRRARERGEIQFRKASSLRKEAARKGEDKKTVPSTGKTGKAST